MTGSTRSVFARDARPHAEWVNLNSLSPEHWPQRNPSFVPNRGGKGFWRQTSSPWETSAEERQRSECARAREGARPSWPHSPQRPPWAQLPRLTFVSSVERDKWVRREPPPQGAVHRPRARQALRWTQEHHTEQDRSLSSRRSKPSSQRNVPALGFRLSYFLTFPPGKR